MKNEKCVRMWSRSEVLSDLYSILYSSLFKSHKKPYVCIARKNFIIGSHILFINFLFYCRCRLLLLLRVFSLTHFRQKRIFIVFGCLNVACWMFCIQCYMFCYSKFQHWVAWFQNVWFYRHWCWVLPVHCH